MLSFEILCVTMNQSDFSKISEMNIHSNVVFANQTDSVDYKEEKYDGIHTARMISTNTKGVGINRNLSLMYAQADICLLADDDVVYCDDVEKKVISEFEAHPEADIFIFNLISNDSKRKPTIYQTTFRPSKCAKKPWGGCRIAFRLSAIKKANIWFSSLFGGGTIFSSGEDSKWIRDIQKSGLTIFVSKEIIANVSYEESTWFTGYDEKYFWGKGAYCQSEHRNTFFIWAMYYLFRYRKKGNLSLSERFKWMLNGRKCYDSLTSFDTYLRKQNNEKNK